MNKQPVYAIASESLMDDFPSVETALRDPDGLLAAGGDLESTRLLTAYRRGIFPWYSEGSPILWWSPDPRCVLYPDDLKISRSLRKTLDSGKFEVRFDTNFEQVVDGCAAPRINQSSTWITDDIRASYIKLFEQGHAHSVEAWQNGKMVGGLYGIAIGKVFFGESMFASVSDASKIAFCALVERIQHWGYQLIDCQVHTEHLESLGAIMIPRAEYIAQLDEWCEQPDPNASPWIQKQDTS